MVTIDESLPTHAALLENQESHGISYDDDGHKLWRPQQWRPQTITAPKEVHDGHMEDYDGQIHDGYNNDNWQSQPPRYKKQTKAKQHGQRGHRSNWL